MNDKAQVASDVVSGLKQSPMLLALVVLNVLGIGTAAWFLKTLASDAHERTQWLIEHCIDGKTDKQ